MTWYRIHLTNNQVGAYQSSALLGEFSSIQIQLNFPADVALFRETASQPDRSETYYVSPMSGFLRPFVELIDRYGGAACSKPDAATVHVELKSSAYVDDMDLLN